MKTLYKVLINSSIKHTLVPLAIIEIVLIATLYITHNYQIDSAKDEMMRVADKVFRDKSTQIASNISNNFEDTKKSIRYIQRYTTNLFNNPQIDTNNSLNLEYKDRFFQNDIDNKSSIYTTNLSTITQDDKQSLYNLSLIYPLVEDIISSKKESLKSISIHIDKYYTLSYPPIDTKSSLNPNIDITKYDFYYGVNKKYNPNKDVILNSQYNQLWAIREGNIGTILAPIYKKDDFIGVVNANISIDTIANILQTQELPFDSYIMLLSKDDMLILSSDEKKCYKDTNKKSFYYIHKNQKDILNISTLDRVDVDTLKENNIVYQTDIKDSDYRIVIVADKNNIYRGSNEVYNKLQNIGLSIAIILAIIYIALIAYIFSHTKKLANKLSKPLKKLIDFSNILGFKGELKFNDGDIIEYKKLKENLNSAHHKLLNILTKDNLTGLYNRRRLMLDIQPSQKQALIMLDIAQFKYLNSVYGSSSADIILKEIVNRLDNITEDSKSYRVGADEFAILLTNYTNDDVIDISNRVLDRVNEHKVIINDLQIEISCALGVAFSDDSSTLDLYSKADQALSNAKEKGFAYMVFEDNQLSKDDFKQNLIWAKKLKHAIKNDNLVAYFQPIYNYKTNKIEKFESLVRLIDNNKVISPCYFLDIAKKIGKLNIITKIMITKVFEIASQYKDIEFSINISFHDFEDKRLLEFIQTSIEIYDIEPKRIVFEILESEAISDYDLTLKILDQLQALGFQIAIDDFGSGHSNFAHLLNINANYIKIDGQFVKDISSNENSYKISKIIKEFSVLIDAKVIAEYVADKEIFDIVKALDIDYAQGYYISEPIEPSKIDDILQFTN
jgi:diguanylate cyclase (GGDEF)-like protein